MTTSSFKNSDNNNNNNNNKSKDKKNNSNSSIINTIKSLSSIPSSHSVGSNLNTVFSTSSSNIPHYSPSHLHTSTTKYPNISSHILVKSNSSISNNNNSNNYNSTSVGSLQQQQQQQHHHHHHNQFTSSPNQRVIDPDEEPINVRTFAGIFYSFLIFIISFLPLFAIEKLLTLFAWVQLELLKAKGRGISPEQSYSKLKKKRKLLKKKKPQIIIHKSPLTLKHHKTTTTTTTSPTTTITHKSKLSTPTTSTNNLTTTTTTTTTAGLTINENEITPNIDTQINNSVFTITTPTIKLTSPIETINEDNNNNNNNNYTDGSQDSTLTPITHHNNSIEETLLGSEDKPLYQLVEESSSINKKSVDLGGGGGGSNGSSLHSSSDNLLKLAAINNIRQRSDSVSVLPLSQNETLNTLTLSGTNGGGGVKPISEIRRVNSEATLYQTSEDTLLFEANQQSKKEFEDFLRSVKDIKDVHNWLKNFSGSATRKIAIVKISRRILDTPYGVESAASSLCFMYKFGLYPIVIHGGLNDISKLPISEVIKERRMRSALLKEAIKKNGVGSTMLTPDICEIEPIVMTTNHGGGGGGETDSSSSSSSLSEDELEYGENDILPSGGLTMKINSFDYEVLTKALDKGKIPIWDSVAETGEGIDIPINSDITTFELAKRIQPYKIIFACNDGGILDSDHKAIPVVYLDQDYKHLLASDHITDRRRVQLKQMKRIVDNLPPSTMLVVSSIEMITHQLLFPRLANGTIIKKSEDNKVIMYDSTNFNNGTLDHNKLRVLIEDSFGRPLSEDYFDYLKETLHKLYLCVNQAGEYNGCAIVTFKHPDYIPYLCKFCVRKSAQGLGLGDLIWRILQRDNDKLYWRSRNNNPLNPWYFQRCQGSFRADESFTIFWYGDDRFEDGSHMIEAALNKPITVLPIVKA